MRDAQHLHTMISNTSDLAEKVSSKVRLLDLVKVGHIAVVGQNEIQVKMKFLFLLTLIIHGS